MNERLYQHVQRAHGAWSHLLPFGQRIDVADLPDLNKAKSHLYRAEYRSLVSFLSAIVSIDGDLGVKVQDLERSAGAAERAGS